MSETFSETAARMSWIEWKSFKFIVKKVGIETFCVCVPVMFCSPADLQSCVCVFVFAKTWCTTVNLTPACVCVFVWGSDSDKRSGMVLCSLSVPPEACQRSQERAGLWENHVHTVWIFLRMTDVFRVHMQKNSSKVHIHYSFLKRHFMMEVSV